MDKFVIEGGHRLEGSVRVGGAKNATLPIMAASLLVEGETRLHNVPRLRDVDSMAEMLEVLGATVQRDGSSMVIDTTDVNRFEAPYELVRRMRASIYVLGPLTARLGEARVSLPGGCAWGHRPVDLHVRGMASLGAEVTLEHGYIHTKSSRLRGGSIHFDVVSVGATANVMMAAVLADGSTTLTNCAREPHVLALGECLQGMGAEIRGLGTGTIEIDGVDSLRPTEFTIIPDTIEAGTFAVAAVITHGDLELQGVCGADCRSIFDRLEASGATIDVTGDVARVRSTGRPGRQDIRTAPHPGFPTDMQAQLMALLAVADGTSSIVEGIYPDRFTHVPELRRMGADIRVTQNTAIVHGVESLQGAPVMATDLRASAAMVLAGLVAEGETTVRRVYHIDRGYEQIEKKLAALGAQIRRASD